MRYFIVLSATIVALGSGVAAETYIVNPEGTGDFPTIQAAVDAVVDGEIIELTAGTFTGDGNRDIDYLGKAITVQSQSGNPESCVIDCETAGRGFRFHSGGRTTHDLDRFQGGRSWQAGPASLVLLEGGGTSLER